MRRRTTPALGLALLMLISIPTAGGEVAAADAKSILKTSGVKGGLVVHVNCGDGKLTAGLLGDGRFLVHGLDCSAENVAKAREHIRSLGVYGRASVDLWKGGRLPYVENLVNLLVVSGKGLVSEQEAVRVLAPRGVALIGGKKIVKPWPADLDEWTHWLHDSGNNAVSRDRRVGVARHLQWVANPLWSRNHNMLPSFSAMVSAKGRIFYIIDEGGISTKGLPDKWVLAARDAFNGVLLWKVPIKKWGWKIWSKTEFSGRMRFQHPNEITRRLVAAGDVLYVTLGFDAPVTALDAATGKVLKTFEGTEKASEMLLHDGLLVLTRNVPGKTYGKDLLVVNPASGKTLWQKKGFKGVVTRGNELSRFTDTFVTAGGKGIFFVNGDDVVALDLRSGKELWKVPRPEVKKVPPVKLIVFYSSSELCSLVYAEKRLFLGQIVPEKINANSWQAKEMILRAMDPASGKTLWEKKVVTLAHFTPPDVFVSKGRVWALQCRGELSKKRSKINLDLVGLDVASGEARKTYKVDNIQHWHHHRCYRDKATERYYMAGDEGVEYIDLESGKLSINYWLRGACRYGVMPANGLLYLPAHSCGCHANRKLNGFYALATRSGKATGTRPGADRLTKGPAFGAELAAAGGGADDWPIYRHDRARSGCTASDVPAKLTKAWERSLGGRLTPPVVAGGKVLLGSKDTQQVYCLDAGTGKVGWRFTADGPVDTPPTWSRGRVCFGTHGGSVYCLAGDGRLAWRFRAAPEDSRVVAFGRLESPWPVHGSVLVAKDKVFCAAGRSSNLDSGIYLHALDLESGKLLGSSHQQARPDRTVGSALPDILVADDEYVYMRDQTFDGGTLGKPKDWRGHRHLLAADGGLLDGTWINAAYWKYGNVIAQLLVFDGQTVFGVQAVRKLEWKSYSHDVFTPGRDGYRVFSAIVGAGAGGKGRRKKKRAPRPRWDKKVPVRPRALLLARRHLFLAGAPDVAAQEDPWAAFEGRDKGVLYVLSREDGSKVAEYQLPAAPVYDGLAAAGGRLFLTLTNGSVICIGPEAP
jgi:outer membrane protein assembly factor BamB